MTPEERRAKLEQLLLAGDHALELMVTRWTWFTGTMPGRQSEEMGEQREKFIANLGGAFGKEELYYPIVQKWYDDPFAARWPIRDIELETAEEYFSVEQLIEDALALGFIDQAMKVSRAWKESA